MNRIYSYESKSMLTPMTDAEVKSTNRTIDLIGCGGDGGLGPVDAVTALFAQHLERDLRNAISMLTSAHEWLDESAPPKIYNSIADFLRAIKEMK